MSSQPFNPRRFKARAANSDSDSEDETAQATAQATAPANGANHSETTPKEPLRAASVNETHSDSPPPKTEILTATPAEASAPASGAEAPPSSPPRELSCVPQEQEASPDASQTVEGTASPTTTVRDEGADETQPPQDSTANDGDDAADDEADVEDEELEEEEGDEEVEAEDEEEEAEEDEETQGDDATGGDVTTTAEASPVSRRDASPGDDAACNNDPSAAAAETTPTEPAETSQPSTTEHVDPTSERSLMVPQQSSIFDRLYAKGKHDTLERKKAAARREEERTFELFVRTSGNLTFKPEIHESVYVESKAVYHCRTTDSRNPRWLAKEQERLDMLSDRMNPRRTSTRTANPTRISQLAEPKPRASARPPRDSTGSTASTNAPRTVDPAWLERMSKPKKRAPTPDP